jgi:hypothetical protein
MLTPLAIRLERIAEFIRDLRISRRYCADHDRRRQRHDDDRGAGKQAQREPAKGCVDHVF